LNVSTLPFCCLGIREGKVVLFVGIPGLRLLDVPRRITQERVPTSPILIFDAL